MKTRKTYKKPVVADKIVLEPEEVMAAQGGNIGSFTSSEGAWTKDALWEDDDADNEIWNGWNGN